MSTSDAFTFETCSALLHYYQHKDGRFRSYLHVLCKNLCALFTNFVDVANRHSRKRDLGDGVGGAFQCRYGGICQKLAPEVDNQAYG